MDRWPGGVPVNGSSELCMVVGGCLLICIRPRPREESGKLLFAGQKAQLSEGWSTPPAGLAREAHAVLPAPLGRRHMNFTQDKVEPHFRNKCKHSVVWQSSTAGKWASTRLHTKLLPHKEAK